MDTTLNLKQLSIEEWNEFGSQTGKYSWYEYASIGSMVTEDVINNFVNIMPPQNLSSSYFQMGEPYSSTFDEKREKYRNTYMTFSKRDGNWIYCGNCFPGETENIE